jgi:hypothetical protein
MTTDSSRVAQTIKQIGELHLQLAQQLETSPSVSAPADPSATRSLLVELVRSVLAELGLLPSSHPDEDPMAILFRDFGFAHMRFAMKGDDVVVEAASGFEMKAYSASKLELPACGPGSDDIKPEPITLPANTKLVRLRLSADHKIDPSEVVAMAVPADLTTAYRYDPHAISVDDKTIYVTVRCTDPDLNAPTTLARVNVLLFRIK